MPRWKKPSPRQSEELRQQLALSARLGELHIPNAVTQMRKALGLTQDEFAALLKMTRRQIAALDGGMANPTLETLKRIGAPFGFTVGFVPVSSDAGQAEHSSASGSADEARF